MAKKCQGDCSCPKSIKTRKTVKCVCCKKAMKVFEHFKPLCHHEKEQFIVEDGNCWSLIGNFGSNQDLTVITLAICDKCLNAYKS